MFALNVKLANSAASLVSAFRSKSFVSSKPLSLKRVSASGISFLPHSDHSYKQAPYQEVSKEEYEDLLSRMPKEIRWEDLSFYETEDGTSGTQTLACTSDGNCEIVDISA